MNTNTVLEGTVVAAVHYISLVVLIHKCIFLYYQHSPVNVGIFNIIFYEQANVLILTVHSEASNLFLL